MRFLNLHRRVGLLAAPLAVVAAGTAIALNHQDLIYQAPETNSTAQPYAAYMLSLYTDPRFVLVGTSKGLYRSTDGGRGWKLVHPAQQVIAVAARSPDELYLATRGEGVLHSRDAGTSWEPLKLPFEGSLHGLTVDAAGLTLLAEDGLHRLDGDHWETVAAPPAAAPAPGRQVLRTIYNLHDGQFWGKWGVAVTDLTSLAILLMVLSGYAGWLQRRRA